MLYRSAGLAIVSVTLVLGNAAAQIAQAQTSQTSQTSPRTVHGTAYDSLRGAPLAGALVGIAGLSRTTYSDAGGRFQFDGVAAGAYTFTMVHAAFDSVGLAGTTARVVVSAADDTVRMWIPSYSTLWRTACGASDSATTSSFIYGTVRDAATQTPVANAAVSVRWLETALDRTSGIHQRRWDGTARSDSSGTYSVCGLPPDVIGEVSATKDSVVTGVIDVLPSPLRVQRVDLSLGSAARTGVPSSGTVVGKVVGASGAPIAGARVAMDGLPDAHTNDRGVFLLRDVPVGSRQFETTAIGRLPVDTKIDVTPGDTTIVPTIELKSVTTLPSVKVTATSIRQRRVDDMAERRRLHYGHAVDSTTIAGFSDVRDVIGSLIDMRGICAVLVDGWEIGVRGHVIDLKEISKELKRTSPANVAVIESLRGYEIPLQYRQHCPGSTAVAILVWTKGELP